MKTKKKIDVRRTRKSACKTINEKDRKFRDKVDEISHKIKKEEKKKKKKNEEHILKIGKSSKRNFIKFNKNKMSLKNEIKMNEVKDNIKSDSSVFITTEAHENINEEYETNVSELRKDKRKKKKKINANDNFLDNNDTFYSTVLKSKKVKGKENKVKNNIVKSSEHVCDYNMDSNFILENKSQKITNKINKKKELIEINKDNKDVENNKISNSNGISNKIDKDKNINEILLKENINIDKKSLCSNLNKNDQVVVNKRKSRKTAEAKVEKTLKKTRKEYIRKHKKCIEYTGNKKKGLSNSNIKRNSKENFIDEFSMNNKEKNIIADAGDPNDKLNKIDNENNETDNRKNNFNMDNNPLSEEKPHCYSNILENEVLADTSEKTLNSYYNVDVDNSTESNLGSISKGNDKYDSFYVNEVKDSKTEEFIDLVKVDYIDNKKKMDDFNNIERTKMEVTDNKEMEKIDTTNDVINTSMYVNNNVENKVDLITQPSIVSPVVEKKKRGRKRKIQKNYEFLVNTNKKANNTENRKLPKVCIYKKEKKNDLYNNQLYELDDDKYLLNNLGSFDRSFSLRKNGKFGNNNSVMQTRRKSKDVKIKDEKYSPYADYIYNKNGGKRKYTKRKYKKKFMTSSAYPTDVSNNIIKYKNNKYLDNKDKRLFPNETFMNKEEFMNNINNINTIFNFNEEFLKFLCKVSKCKDIDYDSMLSFLGDIQIKLSKNLHEEFSSEFYKSHNVDYSVYALNHIVDILNNNNEILSKLNQLEYKFYYDYLKNKSNENQNNCNLNEIREEKLENISSNTTQDNNEYREQIERKNIENNNTINEKDYSETNETDEGNKKINEIPFSKDNLAMRDVLNGNTLSDECDPTKNENNENFYKNKQSSMDYTKELNNCNNINKEKKSENNDNNDNEILLKTINSDSIMKNSTDLLSESKMRSSNLNLFNAITDNINDGETGNTFNKNNIDMNFDSTKEINNRNEEKNYINNSEYKNENSYKLNYQSNIDFVCDELNKLIKETLKNEYLFYSRSSKSKYENISERSLYKNYISTKIYKSNNIIDRGYEDMCSKYSNNNMYENKEDNNVLKNYIEYFRKVNFIDHKGKLYDYNDGISSKSTTIDAFPNFNYNVTKESFNQTGDVLSQHINKMNDSNSVNAYNINGYNSINVNKIKIDRVDDFNNNINNINLNEQANNNSGNIATLGDSKNINCYNKENEVKIDNASNNFNFNLIFNTKIEKYETNEDNKKNKEEEEILIKNEGNIHVEHMENNKKNEDREEMGIIDKGNTNNFNQEEVSYYDVNENNCFNELIEKKETNNVNQGVSLMQDTDFVQKKYNDTILVHSFSNSHSAEFKNNNTIKDELFEKCNSSTENSSTNDNREENMFLDNKKESIENYFDIKNGNAIKQNYNNLVNNEYRITISHNVNTNIKKEINLSRMEKEDVINTVNGNIKSSFLSEKDIFYEVNKNKKIEYYNNVSTDENNTQLKNTGIITNSSDSNNNDKKNQSSFLLKEELNDKKIECHNNKDNEINCSNLKSEMKSNDILKIKIENKDSVDSCNLNTNNNTPSNTLKVYNKKTITNLLKETFNLKHDEIINIKTDKTQKEILDCLSMISKIKKIFFDECTKMINNQIYILEKNFRIPNCSLSILKNSFGYNSNK